MELNWRVKDEGCILYSRFRFGTAARSCFGSEQASNKLKNFAADAVGVASIEYAIMVFSIVLGLAVIWETLQLIHSNLAAIHNLLQRITGI